MPCPAPFVASPSAWPAPAIVGAAALVAAGAGVPVPPPCCPPRNLSYPANGLLAQPPPTPSAATGRAVVRRAIALRGALYAVLVGDNDGENDPWSTINREVRAAGAGLAPTAGGGAPATWWLDPSAAAAPLAAVAWSAAGFLTSPAAGTVGACPGAGCGWVFTDPRGRRRWCSMAWCGNRAKANRHAQRRRVTSVG